MMRSLLLTITAALASALAAPADAISFETLPLLQPVDIASTLGGRVGHAVAADGDFAVVGSAGLASDARVRGSVFIFRRDGERWVQESVLFDPTGEPGFGWAVAIEGNRVLVGSPNARPRGEGTAATGKARVYERDFNGVWTVVDELTAPDGEEGDAFGYSVALRNGVALIGAPADDTAGVANHGSAWAMSVRERGLRQKLVANDFAAGDVFGISVAFAGDRALAGSIGADAGAVPGAGAVYAFSTGPGYPQVQKLVAPDASAGDGFGISLAGSATRVVVGAYQDDVGSHVDQGSLHVFARAGENFEPQSQLVAAQGAAGEVLGWSVAQSGDRILAGGRRAAGSANDFASVRAFALQSSAWREVPAPMTSDPAVRAELANSVALAGEVAVVGWPYADQGGLRDRGRVQAFVASGNAWQPSELAIVVNAYGTSYGYSMDIDDGVAVVGGPSLCLAECEPGYAAGGAYVLRRDGAGLMQPEQTLVAPVDGIDGFGRAVAIDGDTIVVSAGTGWEGSAHEGVYVYARRDGRWVLDDELVDHAGVPVQGEKLAIVGDTILVGHFNDAWVFRRGTQGWNEEARFAAGVAGRDELSAVALGNDIAFLGFADFSVADAKQGAVYVLIRRGTQWLLEARLVADDVRANAGFGSDLAWDAGTLLVGARGSDTDVPAQPASAYVFERGAEGWRQAQKLALQRFYPGRGLGLAIAGNVLAIGGQRQFDGGISVFERRDGAWTRAQTLDTNHGRTLAFDGVSLLAGVKGPNTFYLVNYRARPGL